jgi:hypothetical protein
MPAVTRNLLALTLLLAFASCKKEARPNAECANKTNDMERVKELIAGTYNWTHTYRYYFTFQDTLTPFNQFRTEQYVFGKDGKVRFSKNNQTQWIRNYEIDYEFEVSQYPLDSATVVIIKDPQTGQRTQFFRPYLCTDSARFYNPYSSITVFNFYKRN